MKACAMCKKEYDETVPRSEYAEAGEWLAGKVWRDAGQLCPDCLESRAKLVLMYNHELNSL